MGSRGGCIPYGKFIGLVVALAAIGLLAGRWHRASRPQRRAVMPVAAAGAIAFAVLITAYVAAMLARRPPPPSAGPPGS